MRIFIFLFCLSLASASVAQNTVNGTIVSGGLTRDYIIYVPAAYTANAAVPLLFNLHGYTSNNLEQLFYADFRPIADTANFLMVLPNGTLDAQGNRFWNTFLGNSTVDDVAFMRDLLNELQANYNIDANRVYSTGMSNGGFLSYSLACEMSDRITAIASVTGSMITSKLNACNPSRPVPVMEIHGTADQTVPYTGSPLATFVAIPTLVDAWADLNHCDQTPVVTQVPNTNMADGCTAERQVYLGGDQGSTVEHYKITGGGHTWPGAVFNIGVTNQDINACREIWRFFKSYRLDQFTATKTPDAGANAWSAFPNPVQDELVLQAKGLHEVAKIQVFDALGRLKTSLTPVSSNSITLKTSDWAAGIYWVIVEEAGRQERIQVLKTEGN